jgi:hypothetical protein
MRLVFRLILAAAFRRHWRRHMRDQYAVMIAHTGLTRAEQETFLSLRRVR